MEQRPASQRAAPWISMALGLLSIWPYLIWATAIPLTRRADLPALVDNILGVIVLLVVPCNGIPFGLAAIVVGFLALRKQRGVPAIIGILTGLLGCAGNLIYFLLL